MSRSPKYLAAAAAFVGMAVLATIAGAAGPANRFSVPPDTGGQACRAERLYGSDLLRQPADRGYALFCGSITAPVGHLYLLHGADALGRWRAGADTGCAARQDHPWTGAGAQSPAGFLCLGKPSLEGGVEPAEEWASAQRDGAIAAGDALSPALASLQGGLRVLLGAAPAAPPPPASRVASISAELGGDRETTQSIDDYESLVQLGHESNVLWLFSQAAEYFARARELHRLYWPNDDSGEADIDLELALNLANQRRFADAAARMEEARSKAAANPLEMAKVELYQAEIFLVDDRENSRIPRVREALAAAQVDLDKASGAADQSFELTRRASLLRAMILRARAVTRTSDPKTAAIEQGQALATLLQMEDASTDWLSTLIARDQARLALRQNHPDEAVAILQRTVGRLGKLDPGSHLIPALQVDLGRAYAKQGKRAEALSAFQSAFARYHESPETLGGSPDAAVSYVSFLAADIDGATLPIADPRAAPIFDAFESVNASSVRQTAAAAVGRLAIDKSRPELQGLVRAWQNAERDRVRTEIRAAEAGATPSLGVETARSLQAANAAANRAELGLYSKARNFGSFMRSATSLNEVAGRIGPRDLVVRLLVGPNGGVGLLLTAKTATPFTFAAKASDISSLVGKVKVSARGQYSFDTPRASELFAALFTKVRDQMLDPAYDRLVIDAPGDLSALPFNVLPTATSASKDFQHQPWLGQRLAVVTTAGLKPLVSGDRAIRSFVGYGGALKQAADSEAVTRVMARLGLLGPCRNVVTDVLQLQPLESAADVAAFRVQFPDGVERLGPDFNADAVAADKALQTADLVLFATHGVFLSQIAGREHVKGDAASASACLPEAALLTSPSAQSGRFLLDTNAVLDLQLMAKVVFLSACDTGMPTPVDPGQSGLPSGGDALSGFARAFIYAGARSVMVTHWQVDDKFASIFAGWIAEALKAGMTPEDAIRTAQRRAQTEFDGRYADPFYWGPYALISTGLQ